MGGIATKEVQDDLWGQDYVGRYKRDSTSSTKPPPKPPSSPSPRERGIEPPAHLKSIDVGDPDSDDAPNADALTNPENYDPQTAGPIFPNGEINWECPCLGGAAHGPCGTEFRQAFSCFHYSTEEVKGSECFPQFKEMHTCFSKYPELYGPKEDDDLDDEDELEFDEDELKVINDDNDQEEPEEPKAEKSKKKESRPSSPAAQDGHKKAVEEDKPREALFPPRGTPAVL